jgi:adenosylhomocysteine nucleosidase
MIAILCGLASEAAALRGALPRGVPVAVAGARPARALALARELLDAGATALLSVGVAGALEPELRPGALLVPAGVCHGLLTLAADPALVAALVEACGARPARVVAGVDAMAATPADKAELRAATGAALVDMETHMVARAAAAAGRPWAALRAIADGAATTLPAWTARLIRADGRVDSLAAAQGVLTHPADLPALLRVGRASARAHAALRRAAPGLAAVAGAEAAG